MVEDIDRCRRHGRDRVQPSPEIRDEDLHPALGQPCLDGARGGREVSGAAVDQVVAVDRGDHHVVEAEPPDRDRNAVWLVGVDCEGAAMRHGAEAAVARAGVAEEHEGSGLVPPALADVRAMCLLAHRVKAELLHRGAGLREVRTARCPDARRQGLPLPPSRPRHPATPAARE